MKLLFLSTTLSLIVATSDASSFPSAPHALLVRGGAQPNKAKKGFVRPPAPFRPPAKATKPVEKVVAGTGTATIPQEVFNLVKGIVGVGVLSLPAGIAVFADSPAGLGPALFLIAAMGILSAFGFATIGRVCAYTGATSYRQAWSLSVGPRTSWIPSWSATLKTSMACLAYSMVLADTFCSLLGSTQRTKVLLGLTIAILLPLCWLKDLASLSPFSLVCTTVRKRPFFKSVSRPLLFSSSWGCVVWLIQVWP